MFTNHEQKSINRQILLITIRPPDRVCNRKIFFLFLNQNIYCGYSKEASQENGSFEHQKHMFKLMD